MKTLRIFQRVSILVILGILSGCAGIYENGKELADDTLQYVDEVTVNELDSKIENMEDFFLIDVRQSSEFENGNIPYSVSIPRGILEFKIGDDAFWKDQDWYVPKKDAEIIIYCKKGDRGILCAKILNELGYTNVKNLKGGIHAWDPEFDTGSPVQEDSGCGG